MPSYLILRFVAFIVAVLVPMTFIRYELFAAFAIPLTIAHYTLAFPYSRKYLVDVVKRPQTTLNFALLTAGAFTLCTLKIPYLMFVSFGFHHVFSEVYVMYENVLPKLWSETKALRMASLISNLFAYFAAVGAVRRAVPHLEGFLYSGYAIFTALFIYQLFRLRKTLTREQMLNASIFEMLGLTFVIAGAIRPLSPSTFIFYHVIFWLFYPSSKMIAAKQLKPLAIFLGANAAITILLMLLSPLSPLPIKLSGAQIIGIFTYGALFHIIMSFAMTSAQPAWITRIFHPGFTREGKSTRVPAGQMAPAAAAAAAEPTLASIR
ncbi:MAG TPA: hypothetical protein EYN91_03890 [Candidatus Melainabacteria bacterium]|nr:hypothetical protein [Candidatus Melainabacteria bacterium]HIN67423.1 hypothetical protein [Candidatus Obscuribacterales bacterium]